MGSSRLTLSGWTVVKTERDFPAVWKKMQDHRFLALVFFVVEDVLEK